MVDAQEFQHVGVVGVVETVPVGVGGDEHLPASSGIAENRVNRVAVRNASERRPCVHGVVRVTATVAGALTAEEEQRGRTAYEVRNRVPVRGLGFVAADLARNVGGHLRFEHRAASMSVPAPYQRHVLEHGGTEPRFT